MHQPEFKETNTSSSLEDVKIKILVICQTPRHKEEIYDLIGVENKPYSYKKYIKPLLDQRYLQHTVPGNPRANTQKYISSRKSINYLKDIA